jgi:Xaa-Pro aminopeptidase
MMKRGFINWDKREVNEEDFQKRKEKVLAKMREEDLRYLLVYGDVWQCDEVQYLSNFNTYTRDCLLVLDREGRMSLISSMTPRDREWIAGFTPVAGPDISFSAGLIKGSEIMKRGDFTRGKVGLVGDFFPKVLFEHLKKEFPGGDFIGGSEWYRGLRRVKDSSELTLIKRAALLGTNASKALLDSGVFGKKETDLSAQAEWLVRSRGGEDCHFFCNSKEAGFLDFPGNHEVKDIFAFTLLTQYKGCWAMMGRTFFSPETGIGKSKEASAYRDLVSETQKEGTVESLDKLIKEAKAQNWSVDIKSPVGPDTPSSVIRGLERVPGEKESVFTVSFSRENAAGFFVYVETLRAGEEGYEVLTQ